MSCFWCQQPESIGSVLFEEDSFVVFAPGAASCAPKSLTLVPRIHVAVLTELPAHGMADVLAGLSKLASTATRVEQFKVVTHVEPTCGHVHFHPMTNGGLIRVA